MYSFLSLVKLLYMMVDNLKSFLNKVKNQWILNIAILFASPSL